MSLPSFGDFFALAGIFLAVVAFFGLVIWGLSALFGWQASTVWWVIGGAAGVMVLIIYGMAKLTG